MDRRRFITVVGGGILASPLVAEAQAKSGLAVDGRACVPDGRLTFAATTNVVQEQCSTRSAGWYEAVS
jgi:hypothetical protein